ncbi:MAG: hypothetical protein U0234_30375 [Sandaracinus sp.]
MHRFALVSCALALTLAAGCSCATESTGGDTGTQTMDAGTGLDGNGADVNAPPLDTSTPPIDGNGFDVNAPADDTSVPGLDGNGFDVGPPGCHPAMCQSHLYACGNCLDDDADGLIDAEDPDCLGPCGNNEAGFDPMIPGISLTNCSADCFYDQDGGNGNDGCTYDYRCDPLSPDVNPGGPGGTTRCDYDAATAANTNTCPPTQPAMCHTTCGPLTPNGCDCFGCCEVTPGSGDYVFVGSVPDAGHPACSRDSLDDPQSCRPCTPVADCLNTCEHCELCFGRDTLPADCFPSPDAGVPVDAFVPPYPDGATPDAYVPPVDSGVPMRCPATRQPCGLPTDPACPAGEFCITGCCQYFG